MDRSAWDVVGSQQELRELVGEPVDRVRDKVRDRLHPMDLAFLAASPFWVMATSAPGSGCGASPKGDPAGSVLVLDDRTLALPERPGNRRVDGFLDLLADPHVGLLFLVPGRGDTLRVNGRATLVRDAPFLDDMVVQGHRPSLAVVVDVEEVFFHCSKAFLRSGAVGPGDLAPRRRPAPRGHRRRRRAPGGDGGGTGGVLRAVLRHPAVRVGGRLAVARPGRSAA